MDHRTPVVAGAWLTQFTVIGLMFSFGLFFEVFDTEFGWPRAVLSDATALAFFVMGTLAILGGRLADRYGPRIVLGTTGVIFGVGYALISQVSAPWQLMVVFGTLIGIGLGTHDVVTLSTIARWFDRRRGVMTAVVKVGTACGQFSLPPLAAWLILTYGWQSAIQILGAGAVCVLLGAGLLMRAPPEAEAGQPGGERLGFTYGEARRRGAFWRICAIQFLFFPSLMTIPLHIVAHGTDLGMELSTAAWLLSVMAAASVAGRICVGAFTDRIGGRLSYTLCFLPLIASLLCLIWATSPGLLPVIIALYGFGHGGFFTVVSPTVAEQFGLRAHGAIFGTVLFCGTIGGSIGPTLAGRVYDNTGSYEPAFWTLAGMAAIGLAIALSLPKKPSGFSPDAD